MQAPVVHNPILSRKWCDRENDYMSRKINTAKTELSFKCPESFMFSKSKPKGNLQSFSKKNKNNILIITNLF